MAGGEGHQARRVAHAAEQIKSSVQGGQRQVRTNKRNRAMFSKGSCVPQKVGAQMYLTFSQLSSFDHDRVDGNEGRDEEVVAKGPFSV